MVFFIFSSLKDNADRITFVAETELIKMKKLVLFASGSGTNVQRIAEYFTGHSDVEISLVLTNNPKAGVLKRAEKLGLPTLIFSRDDFYHSGKIVEALKNINPD